MKGPLLEKLDYTSESLNKTLEDNFADLISYMDGDIKGPLLEIKQDPGAQAPRSHISYGRLQIPLRYGIEHVFGAFSAHRDAFPHPMGK